ncbi:MAG: SDR family oxidoreductase, partial [Acidimicrobiales bacterium]|nr:SDR family oxidoreductase [Acidimicrobiales bacterium]
MADLGYDGKVAVITGAGGGLGRSHALELAKRGALVVVNDLGGSVDGQGGSHTAAQQVVDEIKAAGGEAVANYDSVATAEGGQAIIQTALDTYERIDIVINNAGILRDAAFKNMTPELLEPVIDVHLKGAFYVTHAAWQHMRDQNYGRIVNTSSAAGIFGNFGQTNYGAAKAGLVGFTRVLAVEGAKNNIKANAIAPVAKTRMTEELLGAMADKLDPSFITPVVAWLAHEDVPVSGEVYSCGGGHVARIFTGVTQGWTDTESLTVEDIRDHFDEIRDEDGYAVPANLTEELMG